MFVVSLRYSLDHGVERHRDALPWCASLIPVSSKLTPECRAALSADRQEGRKTVQSVAQSGICSERSVEHAAKMQAQGPAQRPTAFFLNRSPSRRRNCHTVSCNTFIPRAASSAFSLCTGRCGVFLIRSSMNARCGSSTLLRWPPILQELQIRSSDSASTTSPPTTPLCRNTPRPIGSSRRP